MVSNIGQALPLSRSSPPLWDPVEAAAAVAAEAAAAAAAVGPTPSVAASAAASAAAVATADQGLTLVHFSAPLEPCLTQKNTLHTLNNPLIRATQPLRAPPIPYKALKLS